MRNFLLISALAVCLLLGGACNTSEQTGSSNGGAQPVPAATTRMPASPEQSADAPPFAVAHGSPSANGVTPQASGQSGPDTSALDKKVEQADAKAKSPGATPADKQAAAAAYLERGNLFYNAGTPSLYKFALRDFRRTLRHDPNNQEARAKQQEIVRIYNSLGRPVPDLGNEP